jgi:hypothetical protein
MNHLSCIALLMLAATTTACQREEAPATGTEPAGTQAPVESAGGTPPPVEGAEMTYACTGGELRVTYAGGAAQVSLADGRELMLRRSQPQDDPAQDIYESDGNVLRRQDDKLELTMQEGESLECVETSATA